MDKYLQVFKINFKQEFAYKVNFIMWRVRNVVQIFLLFYLWDAVFATPGKVVFGYNRAQILTYVFGIVLIKAIVTSSKTMEVSGEISRGELSNYLVKPLDYFKYWFTRDVSSKALNITFAVVELFLLYLLLRPDFFLQTNILYIVGFIVSVLFAIVTFSVILFIVSSISFWLPEMGWGAHFLVTVVATEFLSGAIFPIDILPTAIQNFLYLLPFPYLIFFPLQIYLGKISTIMVLKGLAVSLLWLLVLYFLMRKIWNKGTMAYEAYGK